MQCEAEPLIDKFEEFVREHGSQEKADLDALVEHLQKIRKFHAEAAIDDESILNPALRKGVTDYMVKAMSQKYPMLDESLFLKKRWIRYDHDNKAGKTTILESRLAMPEDTNGWIEVPLLVAKKQSSESWKGIASFQTVRPSRHVAFKASFPGDITIDENIYAYQAEAEVFRIYADLLSRKETAGIVDGMISGYRMRPSVDAFWIPTLESIYVDVKPVPSRRDPALVITAFGRKFLCCCWDAANEHGIERLVREFSTGGKVNKARGRKKS